MLLPRIALWLIQDQLLPEPADLPSGNVPVDAEDRAEEEVGYPCIEPAIADENGKAYRDKADENAEEVGDEKIPCDRNFKLAEPQFIFLSHRVPVKEGIRKEDGNESDSVHDHHC